MRQFSLLYEAIDSTTSSKAKIHYLAEAFKLWRPIDSAWLLYLLLGSKLPRICTTRELRQWVAEYVDLPMWLVEESYEVVGDLAETVSLLMSTRLTTRPVGEDSSLGEFIEEEYLSITKLLPEQRQESLFLVWKKLRKEEIFLFCKLMTGGFRVGLSKQNVSKALAEAFDKDLAHVAHSLAGKWHEGAYPTAESFLQIIEADEKGQPPSKMYPFFLAYPVDGEPEQLGLRQDYLAEWKWDGIRAQLIKRAGDAYLWSRGEELISDQFPEVVEQARISLLDGTVLDGELLAWKHDRPMPFSELQRRLNRKTVGKNLLKTVPVIFMSYDLLEYQGLDCREQSLSDRRLLLEKLLQTENNMFKLSETIANADWDDLKKLRAQSRDKGAEGLMLKRLSGSYGIGRKKGEWWKWKVDPLTFDAVLIYAQRGHGRRADVFSDYTFAVWDEDNLVPVAKAYSGLTDEEMKTVDRYIRGHTVNKFGPVSAVEPEIVCEIACEGVRPSSRHKSGIAVRFPRINRLRTDKKPIDADSLSSLKHLIVDFSEPV